MSAYSDGPVWRAFGLSYAAYFVAPRRSLQSMPEEWQEKFVSLINEAVATLGDDAFPEYSCTRTAGGRYVEDDLRHYRHTGPLPSAKPNPNPRDLR